MVELIPPLCGDFEAPGAALFWLYCCQITDSFYVRFYNQISSDNTAVPLISVFLISGTCVILGFQLIKFVFPLEEAAVHPEPAYVYSASVRRWMPGSTPAPLYPEKKAAHPKEMPGPSQSAQPPLAAFCGPPPCWYQAWHQRGRFCRSSGAKGGWPSAE